MENFSKLFLRDLVLLLCYMCMLLLRAMTEWNGMSPTNQGINRLKVLLKFSFLLDMWCRVYQSREIPLGVSSGFIQPADQKKDINRRKSCGNINGRRSQHDDWCTH